MENTQNYLYMFNNYIVNTTYVQILTYSSDETAIPGKASITGLEQESLTNSLGTSLNILRNYDLRIEEAINTNPDITDAERSNIEQSKFVLLLLRSNFFIDNFEIYSEYNSLQEVNLFFFPVYLQAKLFKGTNLHFVTSGVILQSFDPLNIHIENIDVDYYKGLGGFFVNALCNYPEAEIETLMYVKNFSVYYSQQRLVNPTMAPVADLRGSGHYVINDLHSSVWSYLNEPSPQIGFRSEITCMPDIESIRYFNITNATLTLPDRSGTAVNVVVVRTELEIYREIEMIFTNVDIDECIYSSYPPILLYGNSLATFHEINANYHNSSSFFALAFLQWFDTILLENTVVDYSEALNQYTIIILDVNTIKIDGATVINNDFTGTGTDAVFYMTTNDQGNVTINDFKIIDTTLGLRTGLHYIPLGNGHLKAEN